MKIDTVIFGRDNKDLNLLNNPDYNFEMYRTNKDEKDIRRLIRNNILKYNDKLKSKIRYITKPIIKAWDCNEDKLVKIMPLRQERDAQYGINIHSWNGHTTIITAYFYIDVKNSELFFLQFINSKLMYATVMVENNPFFYNPLIYDDLYIKNQKSDNPMTPMDPIDIELELDWLIDNLDIEVNALNKRTKIHNHECRYENHTNNDIKIITSSYFNRLQKIGTFKVSGHLRFQPVGEGRKKRKLIWISEYKKGVYTTV